MKMTTKIFIMQLILVKRHVISIFKDLLWEMNLSGFKILKILIIYFKIVYFDKVEVILYNGHVNYWKEHDNEIHNIPVIFKITSIVEVQTLSNCFYQKFQNENKVDDIIEIIQNFYEVIERFWIRRVEWVEVCLHC
jgi:hypothetical protein